MPVSAHVACLRHQLWIGGGLDDHIGQQRVVSVEGDVDLVGLEGSEVDLRHHRLRRPEHDVRQLGRDHRSAPAVCKPGSEGVQEDVGVVAVDAHVGPVQHLDALPVDPARSQAEAIPEGPTLVRSALDEPELRLAAPEVLVHCEREIKGDLGSRPIAGRHVPLLGDPPKLRLVRDAVARCLAPRCGLEDLEDVPAVVRMRGRSGCDRAPEVASDDQIRGRTADPDLRSLAERVDPAGAHGAIPARDAKRAVAALGLLGDGAIPDGLDPVGSSELEHLAGRRSAS